MGDPEAEEKARQKAEKKRAQKRAAKKVETSPDTDQDEAKSRPDVGKRKTKQENKYRFTPGKKYAAAKSLVDPKKLYSISEAIDLTKKTSYSRFDGSFEVHYLAHGASCPIPKPVPSVTTPKSSLKNSREDKCNGKPSPISQSSTPWLAKCLLNPKNWKKISSHWQSLLGKIKSDQLLWKPQWGLA